MGRAVQTGGNGCARHAEIGAIVGALVSSASAERITITGPSFAPPGQPVSYLVELSDNDDALAGYSLNIRVSADFGTELPVRPNAGLSNFFPERNLIIQGGGALHPLLSVIGASPRHGLFINAVNEFFEPVHTAESGVNDVLAEVWFDVLPGAEGMFTIEPGVLTVLADGAFGPVAFEADPLMIRVPEPAAGLLLVGNGAWILAWKRRARRKAKQGEQRT